MRYLERATWAAFGAAIVEGGWGFIALLALASIAISTLNELTARGDL